MSNELDVSELTPLRTPRDVLNNNNNNRYLQNLIEQQASLRTTSAAALKMGNTSRTMTRVIFDVLVLLCVGLPILFFYLWGEAYRRGFFCNDESLKHPFIESTVKSWMLYFFGMGLPISVILATEYLQANAHNNNVPKYKVFDWDVPPWIAEAYKQIGVFGFGAACSQMITDIAKYSIGRFRPHFFSICHPVLPDGTDCSSPQNQDKYIIEFTCSNLPTPRLLKEVRLSFPSGHSSFSAYTMIYTAIYLQSRMTWSSSKLIKHGAQFFLILLAWFTALSRVSNYKHHWSDVLAGSLIGAICALVVANCVSNLFNSRTRQRKQSTELSNVPTNGRV